MVRTIPDGDPAPFIPHLVVAHANALCEWQAVCCYLPAALTLPAQGPLSVSPRRDGLTPHYLSLSLSLYLSISISLSE
ncbi:MAG: hypothetical protein EOM68_15600 [Spirochaetia bacterium]|nr:hypothetical protein [Spirochaetia bacterium]